MDRRAFSASLPLMAMGALTASAQDQSLTGLAKDARDAWLFAVPIIFVAAVRSKTQARVAAAGGRPVNHFAHARKLRGPEDREVTSPNDDTLYSGAFLDLTHGPVTLRVPDPGQRYLSIEIMDMYTNANVVIGLRTKGGPQGEYRLVGPGEAARKPGDLTLLTPHAWVLARIYVKGQADLPAVHALQDRLVLAGPDVAPSPTYADRNAPWPDYFQSAQKLIDADPPTYKAGLDALLRLRRAGRGDFSRDGYSAAQQAQIEQGVKEAVKLVKSSRKHNRFKNGWSYPPKNLAEFGDNFMERALVAVSGLGALPVQEAMYMRAEGDGGMGVFTSDKLFRLRITDPIPARAFWSLSMYESDPSGTFFFTPNPLNRYSIGDNTPGLERGSHGELDIWISRHDPGAARRANWLPAPQRGPFALTLRAYLPEPALLNGAYRIPPIETVTA